MCLNAGFGPEPVSQGLFWRSESWKCFKDTSCAEVTWSAFHSCAHWYGWAPLRPRRSGTHCGTGFNQNANQRQLCKWSARAIEMGLRRDSRGTPGIYTNLIHSVNESTPQKPNSARGFTHAPLQELHKPPHFFFF